MTTVVVGTGGGIEDLVTEPAASLADDPQFQAVMDVLPSEYYQVSYVDIGQAVDVLTAMLGAIKERVLPADAGVDALSRVSRRPFPPRAARRTYGHSRRSPTNGERRQDRA